MSTIALVAAGGLFLVGVLWLLMKWQNRATPEGRTVAEHVGGPSDADLMWAGRTLERFDRELGSWKAATGRSSAEYGPWLEQTNPRAFEEMSRAWQVMYAAGFVEVSPSGSVRILPNPYIDGTPGR